MSQDAHSNAYPVTGSVGFPPGGPKSATANDDATARASQNKPAPAVQSGLLGSSIHPHAKQAAPAKSKSKRAKSSKHAKAQPKRPKFDYNAPIRWYFYQWHNVRDVLHCAERWCNPRVRILTASVAYSWSPMLDVVNVGVLPPGDGSSEDWLVAVFTRKSGLVFHGSEAQKAIIRAQVIIKNQSIPFSAVKQPEFSGNNAGVFATALAVWVSRNWHEDYSFEYRFNEVEVRKEHRALTWGVCPVLSSIKVVGKATPIPAIELS